MFTKNQTDTRLERQLQNIAPYIGKTPLYPINNLFYKPGVKLFAKLEWQQFGGSIHARSIFHILKNGIESGRLFRDKTILAAAGFSKGLILAKFSAILGVHLKLFIDENTPDSQVELIKLTGAEIQKVPLHELNTATKANFQKRKKEYSFGAITHFVNGAETGGTFTGIAKRLKEHSIKINTTLLLPETALHQIEGWKYYESPLKLPFYDKKITDTLLRITTKETSGLITDAGKKEGLLLSAAGAANLAGAIKISETIERGVIVTLLPDNKIDFSYLANKNQNKINFDINLN
jgi:S-sulfo-L-cysteine synthase (O-acetyl-L-serine-dependent)